jgi:hypothetical protein
MNSVAETILKPKKLNKVLNHTSTDILTMYWASGWDMRMSSS